MPLVDLGVVRVVVVVPPGQWMQDPSTHRVCNLARSCKDRLEGRLALDGHGLTDPHPVGHVEGQDGKTDGQ